MNESNNPSAIRSKKEICEALLRLMEQHPYEEITVKQIVLEAGLVRKTFYRNFTSKDDVMDSILEAMIIEYSTELVTTRVKSPLEVIIGFVKANEHVVMLLDKNDMMHLVLKKLNDRIPGRHDELVAMGLVPEEIFGNLDVTYILPFNIGAMWNVICAWVRNGMKDDPEELVKTLRQYIIRLGRRAEKFSLLSGTIVEREKAAEDEG